MSRVAGNSRKKYFDKYSRNEANVEVGAGPLRARKKQDKTYGICKGWCFSTQEEELYGDLCSFCRWMINDNEVNSE